jgi:copper oxidase (laccase) domain-containing protein
VLAATADGRRVAAIHAGWRGLAVGRDRSGASTRCGASRRPSRLRAGDRAAASGPAATRSTGRFSTRCAISDADPGTQRLLQAVPGHHYLDLGALARSALRRAGVSLDAIGSIASSMYFV